MGQTTVISTTTSPHSSEKLNAGYQQIFAEGQLTLGVLFPIEAYIGAIPTMLNQVALAQRAEGLGFAALWVRDVPLYDPSFGDVGQIYDPWVYLGFIAAQTSQVALGTASIIFTLRHPLHVAKAAASVDQLSGGRLVLGIASGDRPVEYPAFRVSFEQRDEIFCEAVGYFRRALEERFPEIESPLGHLSGADLIPKPVAGRIPLFVTGYSRQTLNWIAANSDGWITYPFPLRQQTQQIAEWRSLTSSEGDGEANTFKPFIRANALDLAEDPSEPPTAIRNGYRLGREPLIEFLTVLRKIGVNHVIFNLKQGRRPADEVVEELGAYVLPLFPAQGAGSKTKKD